MNMTFIKKIAILALLLGAFIFNKHTLFILLSVKPLDNVMFKCWKNK